MTLASLIESDVSDVFFNTNDFAVTVTYTRGGHTISISAIVEPSLYDNEQALGVTRVETRGYLLKAEDLVFGTDTGLPQYGDTITEGSRTYIIPKSKDTVPYEYADENRYIVRVNTAFMRKS